MKANQLFSLDGKIALVTGGGTGLGRQFALTLADAGATVILSGRRTAPLEDTAGAIRSAGGRAHCLALDVSSPLMGPWRMSQAWPGCQLRMIAEDGHGGDAMFAAVRDALWQLTLGSR